MQEAPAVSSVNDLVDYPSDSVDRKALITGKKESVTLFAFDRNQGLSELSTFRRSRPYYR